MAAPKEGNDIGTQKITLKDVITWGGIIVSIIVSFLKENKQQALTDQRQDIKLEQMDKDMAKINSSNDEIIRLLKRINPDEK